MNTVPNTIAPRIDHTNLKANADENDIKLLCNTARTSEFRGVCVNGRHTAFAKKQLIGTPVAVSTVIDFPLGASPFDVKRKAITEAAKNHTDSLDVVWDIVDFLDSKYDDVLLDLTELVKIANGIPVKIIVETCFLSSETYSIAYDIVKASGAAYIKTSTGQYLQDGNAMAAVQCWAKKEGLLIKASGGIRDLAIASEFVLAGADIIGTSYGVSILREEKTNE